MPAITGLQLAARLREIRPNLPVILMTGNGSALTSEQVEAAGVRQVLSKPADFHTLAEAVHSGLAYGP
jgi:FixJ family two-component response regulator